MPFSGADSLQAALETYREFAAAENAKLGERLQERAGNSTLVDHLTAELSHEGKHLRPALTLASHFVFSGGNVPNRECLAAAHALEVFHSFVLIHDDVIDASPQRRNRPTLHCRIEKDLNVPHSTAGHLAIVLGDILFGYAINLLSSPDIDHGLIGPLQQYLATVTEDTGLGEARELTFLDKPLGEVTLDDISEVYFLKTTRYTIEAPLWLGARAAGIPAEELSALTEFARPIGLGFQMENDLHEASLPLEKFERLAYDFQTGVKTLFLRRLYDDLRPPLQDELISVLNRCQQDRSALTRLHELIHSTQTLATMHREVDACFDEARDWIPGSPYSEAQKVGLSQLAQFISTQRKHSEAPKG
ncbi:polyprenyl synthetase family protein [Puniceicoccus vermicola]|uniref:Polyprenyl synthetase family protein n=1 Tax=Puniceicoccus vermicola TaxID=388746 RepID=A0A7X1AVS9_9BACT|nr:polyprenyl synthetase family protein [Puniceicoccus vermicola]MBC2600669.1 polyprenyl synthetase family protein [Puniceicoccus vermicola]